MAKIRFGYSDDFTAKDSSVGINTAEPQANLDVVGSIKGKELKVVGVSSQTGYEGFLRADHQIEEETQLNFGQGINASLSGEIIVGTGQTVTINEVIKETVAVGNGSNNEWYSLSGSYTFKANGDPTWDGSSFTYDGTGDYHQLNGSGSSSSAPESTFEVGSSNFTLEQWVYITSTSSICGTFFSKGNNNSVGTNFMSLQTTGPNTTPGFFFGAGTALLEGSSVGTGGWHHYVVTRSGNNFTLYVDGTSVDTATSSSSLAAGITGGINIGAQSYSVSTDGRKLNGKISITRLYSSRVLTEAEVTLNYNAGHTATTSAVTATVDLNANVPSSYPGTVNTVDATDINTAGGSQIECMKVYNTFTPPSGDTNQRPSKPKPGQLYYNYDLKTIEFHDGYDWRRVDNTTRSGRGVFMGGRSYPAPDTAGPPIADISYIQISSRGNALDFGTLESGNARESGACLGSSIRSIKGGGTASDNTEQNDIQYITTASQGNAIDFGDLTNRVRSFGAVSTSTRGLFAGGCVHPNTDTNHIDFIQISTLGSTAEFGDHVAARNIQGIGNQIKAVFGGGNGSHTIRSINFASKGDTTIFGEVFMVTSGSGTVGNSVRGLFCGGYAISPNGTSVINSITFASDGNGTDFGEMNGTHQTASSGGMSSATKGVFGPGQSTFVGSNNVLHFLDEITISTYGSATDFGDSGPHGNFTPKVSDSHGGLGGF